MRPQRYGSRGSTIQTNDDYGKRLLGLLDSLTMFSPMKPAAESLLYAEDYPVAPFATPEDRFDNLMEDPKYQGLLTDAGMAGQGLPVTAPGIVIGAKAKNFPKALAEKFEKLEESGLSNREAFAETGVYRGPDGKLRYEIDDSQAQGLEFQYTPQEAYKELQDIALLVGTPIPKDLAKELKKYKGLSAEDLVKIRSQNTEEMLELGRNNASGREILKKREEIKGVTSLLDEMSRKYAPVDRFIQHEELAKSYPDLMEDARVELDGNLKFLGSYHRPDDFRHEYIALRKKPMSDDPKSTLLHELQHGIQFREGFDRGGSSTFAFNNPETFKIYQRILKKMKTPISLEEYASSAWGTNKITDEIRDAYDEYVREVRSDPITPELDRSAQMTAAREYYNRLGGEAEARMVQKRMDYTPAERAARFPLDDYDVPLHELIPTSLLD